MNKNLTFDFYLSYFLRGWKEIFFHNRPIFITFFITSKCNVKCEHCFYWQKINKNGNELTLEEIEKISSSIPSFPKLLLSGGEPFLREDVDEICRIFYLNNKVKQITIPTNGILSDIILKKINTILKSCKNSYVQIQLSIDGLGEFHDKIRNAPNTFDRMMKTYEFLKSVEEKHKNFEVNFCFTFSSLNQHFIKDVYDYLASKGNDSFFVLLVREPVKSSTLLEFDFEKYMEWSRYSMRPNFLENKNLSERIFALRKEYQTRIIENVIKDKKFKFKCTAGVLTAVIDEVGFVYPCESWRISFGSLREEGYNFKRIWHGKVANEFRKTLFSNKCRCTHESNIMTNISFSPSLYLKFPIKFLRLRFK